MGAQGRRFKINTGLVLEVSYISIFAISVQHALGSVSVA